MKIAWFLIMSLFAAQSMATQDAIKADHSSRHFPLSGYLQILKDPSDELTLARVRDADAWQRAASSRLSFGIIESAVWLRFSVSTDISAPLPLYLHIDYPVLDEVDVYILEDGRLVNHYQAGEARPFNVRPVDYHGLVFPLVVGSDTFYDVYVRVKNKGSMILPVSLWPQTAFLREQLSVLLVWGLLFSVFLVMTVYNGILYYSTRDAIFGVFSLFCISIFSYFFTLRGFGFQYLWPNASQWQIVSPLAFIATSTALFNLLVYQFLNLNRETLVGKLFVILAVLNAITLVFLVLIDFATVMRTQIILIIATALLTVVFGLSRWKNQNQQERLVFSGIVICALFGIYTTLTKVDVLEVSYFTDNGIAIAVTLMSLLFSFILADRFRSLEKEKQQMQQKSIHYLEQYRSLFDYVSEGVFILGNDGRLLNANPSCCRIFNCKTVYDLKLHIDRWEGHHGYSFHQMLVDKMGNSSRISNYEIELPVSDDSSAWVEINAHYRKVTEKAWQIEGTISDISTRKAHETQLEYMASHDSLTNLLNRRAFERELKSIIADRGEYKSKNALIYLDLDQFKVINDVYGHTVGDEFLRRLSVKLKSELRSEQILARLGGDEFGVICADSDEEEAKKLAQRLLESIQGFSYMLRDTKLTVGASIGLVVFHQGVSNIEVLLSRADAACYMAKDLGRNRMHVYSTADDELKQRQIDMTWVSVINEALEKANFRLYFQLIRPIKGDDRGISYEVLLRLAYQDRLVPPMDFLPAAERYGLMPHIDRWVISNYFRLLGSNPDHLKDLGKASINLSVQSVSDPAFTGFLKQQFELFSIPHAKICFEITETMAISNLDTTLAFINEYREKGCEFAIDDFGTGFSSFAYLKQLPADYLKIDGMFVKSIVTSEVDRSMVAAICEVANKLKICTVAEFVESQQVSDELMRLGVSYGQGYFYDKPSPIEDLLG